MVLLHHNYLHYLPITHVPFGKADLDHPSR
jgi:hypothetical protein